MDKTELLIKLGVDGSNANKQISEINKELKSMDKELKSLDTSTDNFGTNMSNMGKQADITKNKITALQAKLDAQNKALEQANKKYQNALKAQEQYNNGTEKSASETAKHKKAVEQAASQVNKYNREIADTERALNSANQELAEMNAQIAKMPYEKMAKGFQNVSDGLGKVSQATKPLTLALGTIATASINTAMSFEDSMAKISATTGATGDDLEKLEAKAREIGKTTSLSADEGATALLYLAQAGYDTEQSLSAVDDVVNLAIAANIDLGEATKIVTANLASYKIEVDNANRVTDVLAQTASSSNTNVQELGQAFEVIAPVAGALGYTIEDTSLALGILANNAITGSSAGTALRSVLSKLVDPTKETAKAMEKYNISLVNSDGTAKGLKDVLLNLKEAFSGLDETQKAELASTLAGQEGMSALLAIVNSSDADFNKLSDAIGKSNGKTEEMAKVMADTSKGGLKELLSKLEEAFITIGQKLLPIFDKVVDKLGEVLDWFNSLDEGVQDNIIKWGLLIAGISPVTGALSKLSSGLGNVVGKIGELAKGKALEDVATGLGTVATQAGGTIGAIGTATGGGGLIASLGALATAMAPFLVGGTIVVGLGLGIAGIVTGLKNMKDQVEDTGIQWNVSSQEMEKATELYKESLRGNLEEAKETVQNYKEEAIPLLVQGWDEEEPNLDPFKEALNSQLEETKTIINEDTGDMINGLMLFNENATGTTVFTLDELKRISDSHSENLFSGVQTAYDNLMTDVDTKSEIIQGYMEDYGMDYEEAYRKWEEQVLLDYQEFTDQMMLAQTGSQEESITALEEYLGVGGELTYDNWYGSGGILETLNQGLADEKAAIETNANEKLLALMEANNELAKEDQRSMDELVSIADLQAKQEYAIAVENYNNQKQTALDLMLAKGEISKQDYEREFKAIAESKTLNDNYQKYLGELLERSTTDRTGTWEKAYDALDYIQSHYETQSLLNSESFMEDLTTYFENGGDSIEGAIEYCTQQMEKDMDNAETEITGSAEGIQNSLEETADTAESESSRIKKAIDEIEGKDVNVNVNFSQTGYDSLVRKMQHVSTGAGKYGYDPALNDSFSGVNAYNISPYADFFGGMDAESYPTFDFYGLKDTGVKTLSLESLGLDTVSSYATSDSNATGNISTINYNYGGSIATTKTDSGLNQKLDKLISLMSGRQQIGTLLNIEHFENSREEDVSQLVKEISYYLQIHNKRW